MLQPTFWSLRKVETTARRAEWLHGDTVEETVGCPTNDGHQRPGRRLTDLSVTLPDQTVENIVWTWYSECLLTDCALELFKASEFTGFEVKPVKAVFNRAREKPPRLWELVVTGWAGIAPPESGIRLIDHCPDCGCRTYSDWTRPDKLIDPTQWDGSDFFIVWPLPRFIFVTDRVAQIVLRARLSGAVLTAQDNLGVSPSVIAGLSPGRLSYYMPDARARQLGEALGIY